MDKGVGTDKGVAPDFELPTEIERAEGSEAVFEVTAPGQAIRPAPVRTRPPRPVGHPARRLGPRPTAPGQPGVEGRLRRSADHGPVPAAPGSADRTGPPIGRGLAK